MEIIATGNNGQMAEMLKEFSTGGIKMIDIHMHILPGVDDGSEDLNMSIEMLKIAYEHGIREVIATPHDYAFYINGNKIQTGYLTLQKMFSKIKIGIGCEIYCEPELMKTILNSLQGKLFPTMNNTQYILVEFSTTETDLQNVMYCVEMLLKNGYIPIIAHIERYKFFSVQNMQMLKEKGCMLQSNAYSLKNETNALTKGNARLALKEKLVDFIGSDSHRMSHRPPNVKDGIKYIYKTCEKEYAYNILYGNAKKYLEVK